MMSQIDTSQTRIRKVWPNSRKTSYNAFKRRIDRLVEQEPGWELIKISRGIVGPHIAYFRSKGGTHND